MKNPEEIKKIRSKFNSSELADLKWIQVELETFHKEDSVNMNGISRLENIINSLHNLRSVYIQRVISLLKQGNILD